MLQTNSENIKNIYIDDTLQINSPYEFYGRHLILNFNECEVNLNDYDRIDLDLTFAINSIGATILKKTGFQFSPEGLTLLYLLSESHASIHTYPEHNSCFLDVFTCGRTIDVKPFETILSGLWKPKSVKSQYIER